MATTKVEPLAPPLSNPHESNEPPVVTVSLLRGAVADYLKAKADCLHAEVLMRQREELLREQERRLFAMHALPDGDVFEPIVFDGRCIAPVSDSWWDEREGRRLVITNVCVL